LLGPRSPSVITGHREIQTSHQLLEGLTVMSREHGDALSSFCGSINASDLF
jgi:hypothetical protein